MIFDKLKKRNYSRLRGHADPECSLRGSRLLTYAMHITCSRVGDTS